MQKLPHRGVVRRTPSVVGIALFALGLVACASTASGRFAGKSAARAPGDTGKHGAQPPAKRTVRSAPPLTKAQSWFASLKPMPKWGWRYLATSTPGPYESAVYVSSRDVTVRGAIVTAWFRWEFMARHAYESRTYRSVAERTAIDCDRHAMRNLAVAYYAKNNLQNMVASKVVNAGSSQWLPAARGTIAEAMLNWGCAPGRFHRK